MTRTDAAAATAETPLGEQVDDVVDYLVAVRGGAPFLSAADSRLLLQWLDEGVPVALILAAIDTVSERRRKKRARTRLSLSACARTVAKARLDMDDLQQGGAATPASAATAAATVASTAGRAVAAFAEQVAVAPLDAGLDAARQALVAELRTLAQATDHVDVIGRKAAAAIGRFHTAAWQAAASRQAELRQQAEQQLAPMRKGLSGAAWQDLVEEVARDLLRQETPAVSARRLWDTLGG